MINTNRPKPKAIDKPARKQPGAGAMRMAFFTLFLYAVIKLVMIWLERPSDRPSADVVRTVQEPVSTSPVKTEDQPKQSQQIPMDTAASLPSSFSANQWRLPDLAPLKSQLRIEGPLELPDALPCPQNGAQVGVDVNPDGSVQTVVWLSGPKALRTPLLRQVVSSAYQPSENGFHGILTFSKEALEDKTRDRCSGQDVSSDSAVPVDSAAAPPEPQTKDFREVEILRRVAPIYPPEAKRHGIEDTVILEVQVAEDGIVEGVSFVSGHPLFRNTTMIALTQFLYSSPDHKRSVFKQPVRFRLARGSLGR